VLDPDREALALRALARAWDRLNRSNLRGALRPPTFELFDAQTLDGRYSPHTRTLGLSRRLVAESPWAEVVEVLRHEVAHQFAIEVLGAADEAPHGLAFRRASARLGLSSTQAAPQDRIVRKVRALLALAGSPERAEAEAAMAAAHRLMRRHNVELADDEAEASWVARTVGPVKGRFDAWEKALGGLVVRHSFVRGIWVPAWRVADGKRGRVLELCGRSENVEMACWTHDFVGRTGERLWEDHRRRQGLPGRAHRRAFLAGVMRGLDERLLREAAACEETGLVWVGDRALDDFVRRRHPHLRRGTGGRVRGVDAWRAGREAGGRIVLHRPVEARVERRGRLIGAR